MTIVFSVVIKVGMVGDSQIGKTSLMVKYVEGSFDEDYIQTLGELGGNDSIALVSRSYHLTQASTLWKRPSQCGGQRLHFQYGILEDRESSSICFHWSAMTRWPSYSCLTSRGNRRSIPSRNGIDKLGGSTRYAKSPRYWCNPILKPSADRHTVSYRHKI